MVSAIIRTTAVCSSNLPCVREDAQKCDNKGRESFQQLRGQNQATLNTYLRQDNSSTAKLKRLPTLSDPL